MNIRAMSLGEKKSFRVYKVLSRLESTFNSFADVVHFCNRNGVVVPEVPATAAVDEDKKTPRICVARSLADCITAIGVHGVFRRCCSSVEGLPSYATLGREVYPIIVVSLDVMREDLYIPTTEQVPDVEATGELWLTKPVVPSSCDVLWLGMSSLDVSDVENVTRKDITLLRVEHLRLLSMHEVLSGDYDHPWINRRGHYLDSSAMEDELVDWKVTTIKEHLDRGEIHPWDL